MIAHNTPCIRPIADELDHLERARSLVDEITDEVEVILISETDHTTERHEFIIATVDITDEESSRNHSRIDTILRVLSIFLERVKK
jgi:hypothetical protein